MVQTGFIQINRKINSGDNVVVFLVRKDSVKGAESISARPGSGTSRLRKVVIAIRRPC